MMTLMEVEATTKGDGGMTKDELLLFRRRMVVREPPYPWRGEEKLVFKWTPKEMVDWANIESLWWETLGEWVILGPKRTKFFGWTSDKKAFEELKSLRLDALQRRKAEAIGTFHTFEHVTLLWSHQIICNHDSLVVWVGS